MKCKLIDAVLWDAPIPESVRTRIAGFQASTTEQR